MNQTELGLTGKVAVFTGGYGVLCQAMAKALAEQGVKIAILGRNLEKAKEFATVLRTMGTEAIGVKADVLKKEELELANEEVKLKLGPCDFLINGAGGNHPDGITMKSFMEEGDLGNNSLKTFFDLDVEGFKYVFDLNMLGTLLPTQVFAKGMIGRADCSIVNISSVAAIKPLTKVSSYGSAKAAISNFTEWLAVHFSQMGIRVNAIAPGFIETEMTGALDQKVVEEWRNSIPLKRGGQPIDVANAVVFLASDMSAYVTGQTLHVCGGMLM